jgi:hypothetical protein
MSASTLGETCQVCAGKGWLMRDGTDGYNWRWCPRCFGYGIRVDELLKALGIERRPMPEKGVEYVDCKTKE